MKQMMKKTIIHPVAIGLVFDLTPNHHHYEKLKEYCLHPLIGTSLFLLSNLLSINEFVTDILRLFIDVSPLDLPIDPFKVPEKSNDSLLSSSSDQHPNNNNIPQSPHKNAKPVPDSALPELIKVRIYNLEKYTSLISP